MSAPLHLGSIQSIFQFFVQGGCFIALLSAYSGAEAREQDEKPERTDVKQVKSRQEAKARTPASPYKRKIADLVGVRWQVYVQQNSNKYRLGAARIAFQIDRAGKQKKIRVISNTADPEFLAMCVRCIKEPKFPPPPPDAFKTPNDKALEIPFTFSLYPN